MRDAEWAARPCLHEWKLDERPCLWFRSGDGCRETWADEPGAAFAVVRVAALCVLSALSAYTASAFWAARTDRLLRGINERWNALEHLALLAWLAVNVQVLCWVDLDGFSRIYWAGSNYFMWHLVRLCLDLALFRVCETYRQALESMLRRQEASSRDVASARAAAGTPHWHARHGRADGWRMVAASCGVAGVTAAVTAAQSLAPATKRGRSSRGACWLVHLNSLYVVGVSLVELGFIGDVLQRSSRVRHALLQKRGLDRVSKRTRHATLSIYQRIKNLGLLFVMILSYALFVIYRNREGGVACFQPPCGRNAVSWVAPPLFVIVATCVGCLSIKRPPSPASCWAAMKNLRVRLLEIVPSSSTLETDGSRRYFRSLSTHASARSTKGGGDPPTGGDLSATLSPWGTPLTASSQTDFPSPVQDPIGFEMALQEGWLGTGLELSDTSSPAESPTAASQRPSAELTLGLSRAASTKTVGWSIPAPSSPAGSSSPASSPERKEEPAATDFATAAEPV